MIASAKSYGFSVADLGEMTVGALCDILSEHVPDKDRIYIATKEDIGRYL